LYPEGYEVSHACDRKWNQDGYCRNRVWRSWLESSGSG